MKLDNRNKLKLLAINKVVRKSARDMKKSARDSDKKSRAKEKIAPTKGSQF